MLSNTKITLFSQMSNHFSFFKIMKNMQKRTHMANNALKKKNLNIHVNDLTENVCTCHKLKNDLILSNNFDC